MPSPRPLQLDTVPAETTPVTIRGRIDKSRRNIPGSEKRSRTPSWEGTPQQDVLKGCSNWMFKDDQNGRVKSDRAALSSQNRTASMLQKSQRQTRYNALPFHSLSVSKHYIGLIDHALLNNTRASYLQTDFEIIERLGFGTFAQVFKVRWNVDNGIYALKQSILRFPTCIKNSVPNETQLRWMDEAFYHNVVSGPQNIVEFVQSWEESGHVNIQMEYVPQKLSDIIEATYPLSESTLWNIFVDMLMALENLHMNGYCHLDVKPENIFLDKHGVTKLGDFSLVSMPEAKSKTAGDCRYMPLEVIQEVSLREEVNLSYDTDIFSLGMTMLELCTDLRLEPNGLAWKFLREYGWPQTMDHRIPVRMRPIIRQMISLDPRLRPTARGLLNASPLRGYALRRKAFFFVLPILRLGTTVLDFFRSGTSRCVIFFRSLLPCTDDRPVTPVLRGDPAEIAKHYDFHASAIPQMEDNDEDSGSHEVGRLDISSSSEDDGDKKEVLSKSFRELMEDESEVDEGNGSTKQSSEETDDNVSDIRTEEAEISVDGATDISDLLNQVQVV